MELKNNVSFNLNMHIYACECLHLSFLLFTDLSVVRPTRGIISVAAILNCINDKSCLISIMMANNETGVIFPIPELGK